MSNKRNVINSKNKNFQTNNVCAYNKFTERKKIQTTQKMWKCFLTQTECVHVNGNNTTTNAAKKCQKNILFLWEPSKMADIKFRKKNIWKPTQNFFFHWTGYNAHERCFGGTYPMQNWFQGPPTTRDTGKQRRKKISELIFIKNTKITPQNGGEINLRIIGSIEQIYITDCAWH